MSQKQPLRSFIFAIIVTLWTLGWGIFYTPIFFIPGRLTDRWILPAGIVYAHVYLFLARWICGIRYKEEGLEQVVLAEGGGPVIIAPKHFSGWETFFLWLKFKQPTVIIKKELLNFPFIGWGLRRAPVIAVDRSKGTQALKDMIEQAKGGLSQGRHLMIYPEGTRVSVGEKHPYKRGVVSLYEHLGRPVLPIALNVGLFVPKKPLDKRAGTAIIKYLPLIQAGMPRKEFLPFLENQIETETDALIARARATAKGSNQGI